MGKRRLVRREVLQDILRKHLAELHTPLVERENIPDDALHKHLVLIERNEGAKRLGGELVREKRIGRPVAFKCLERNKFFRIPFSTALLGGLAERQSLCLREEVCHELVVVIRNGVVRLAESDEVA